MRPRVPGAARRFRALALLALVPGCAGPPQARPIAWVGLPSMARELGLKAAYDEAPRVVLTGAGMRVALSPGSRLAVVNGRSEWLEAAPRWRSGILQVPASFVSRLKERAAAIRRAPEPLGPVASGSPWPAAWRIPASAPKRAWRYVVIHHSGTLTGSAAEFDAAHKARGWDGLGYHFVIGNGARRRGDESADGEVEVGERWVLQKQGAHAKNYEFNQHGVGVCLVGDFERRYPTPRQMEALKALVRFLVQECGIPPSQIYGHRDVRAGGTDCPGRHFPMEAFKREFR